VLLSRNIAVIELKKAIKITDSDYKNPKEMTKDLGIGGNTFRSYRNFGKSPSKIYRDWVKNKGYKLVMQKTLASRDDFILLHEQLVWSFENHCKKFGCRELSSSEKNKVVDLFTKALAFSVSHPCGQQREGLYNYANIPLDKYSLTAIRELFYGIIVCNNPSMGHVRDRDTYNFLQSQIFQLTSSMGLPNLVFDYYAWNMNHL
jgi:hypothetical protein